MRRPIAPLAIISLAAILSAACSSPDTTNKPASATPLEETRWILVEVDGKAVTIPAGENEAYLRLAPADHKVEGYTGCNRMMGGYVLDGHALEFPGLASTRRYCEPTAALEQGFVAALAATTAYRISGAVLELLADDKPLAKLEAR